MKEDTDNLFAFKTLEEAIEVADNHVINCLCWWTDEHSHNSMPRHVWSSWLECAEDFSQLGKWLRRLQHVDKKYSQTRAIILGDESDEEKMDKLFKDIIGVDRNECELN